MSANKEEKIYKNFQKITEIKNEINSLYLILKDNNNDEVDRTIAFSKITELEKEFDELIFVMNNEEQIANILGQDFKDFVEETYNSKNKGK